MGIAIYIIVIIILLLVIALFIKEANLYSKRIKILTGIYYGVITSVFITGHRRIKEKYQMYEGPVIPEGWEVQSSWASSFSLAFIIPLSILVVYTLTQKVKVIENKRGIYLLIALPLCGFILFSLFMLFNIAYGLRP